MLAGVVTEAAPVAKRKKEPSALPPLDLSGAPSPDDFARIEVQADPAWLERLDATAKAMGLRRAQFIRWACNHLMAALENR